MSPSDIPKLFDIGPLTGVATVFCTIIANVICWAIFSGSKFVSETRKLANQHETDIVVLYDHAGLQRPVLR